ncbi:MAG TPA: hypothetical protein H9694_06160 [Firmicutes bacterium]|nr:hypothetical protein [Bacillota bacterium]
MKRREEEFWRGVQTSGMKKGGEICQRQIRKFSSQNGMTQKDVSYRFGHFWKLYVQFPCLLK